MTLYEQVGGDDALERAVEGFYQRMLADPDVAPWFNNIDLSRLKDHQRAFLAVGLGGPELYEGRSMRDAHVSLGITDAAYSAAISHLRDELQQLGVDDGVVAQIAKRLEMMRAVIVAPLL